MEAKKQKVTGNALGPSGFTEEQKERVKHAARMKAKQTTEESVADNDAASELAMAVTAAALKAAG